MTFFLSYFCNPGGVNRSLDPLATWITSAKASVTYVFSLLWEMTTAVLVVSPVTNSCLPVFMPVLNKYDYLLS